jgi:hypothetical protein
MSKDKHALEELLSESKAGEAHLFLHYLYFPSEPTSKEVADTLRRRGFDVEDRLGADGTNWLVLAKLRMMPTETDIARTRSFFEQMAKENGGEYDGWEAEVKR